MWASYLSALLKGRALEVFVRLSKDDQSDYGQIKEALLTNFDLTERSFHKKFRDCRPGKAETFRQFSGRLASYLEKWLGLAKVEKTYDAVCDFLAGNQFPDCCSHELYLYLKPKPFKVLGELAHEADLFADARGGVPRCIAKGHRETKSQVTHNYRNQVDRKLVREKIRMTWNLILKFFSLLILVVEALYLMNPTDATLESLSVLKYLRWRPRWPSVRLLRPI